MKAVLVIDMPSTCIGCPCSGEEFGMCQAVNNEMECDYYNIPSWCPLRPLPQINIKEILEITKRKSQAYKFGFIDGFNYYKRLVEETE